MQIQKLKPRRKQFKFWLDANREDESAIGWYLDDLRKKRKMTATIRDAVRLLWSLREGRTDILLELFPKVEEMLYAARVEAVARRNTIYGYDDTKTR